MTPKLRFPEFTDEWQVKKLGDLATKVGSGATPTGGSSVYRPSGVPFIRSQNITGGKLNMRDVVFIDEETHRTMRNSAIKPNDVLLNITGASLGRTCVVPGDFKEGNLNQHVCIIRLAEANPYIVHTILSKPKGQHDLLKTQTGGGKEGLNFQAVRSFKLALPAQKEQEKIAEFLMAVDERIALMEKKLELLKKYKKGVMQKIFTQQIRFKDENGDLYPDWEERKVIDIYHFRSTNSLSRDCLSDVGRYQNIHYGDIHKRYGTHLDTVTEDIPRIYKAPQVLIEKFIPESTLNAKDIIMADASEDYRDIGKSLEIINTEGITVAGLHTIVMRPYDPSSIVLGFGAYLFNSEQVRRQIMKLATGVSVLGISLSNLMNVKISVPSHEEQQKIVNVLTALDDKIKEEKARLEFAKQWKRGLLQRMFI